MQCQVPENLQLQEKKESEQRTFIQLRVIEVIQQWLETNFYDFRLVFSFSWSFTFSLFSQLLILKEIVGYTLTSLCLFITH